MEGFRYRKFGRDDSIVWNVNDDELIRNHVPDTLTNIQAEGNSQPNEVDIIIPDASGSSAAAAASSATSRHHHMYTEETGKVLLACKCSLMYNVGQRVIPPLYKILHSFSMLFTIVCIFM